MLRNITGELREIAWLASVAAGLSVIGVSLAITAALVLERLSNIAHV